MPVELDIPYFGLVWDLAHRIHPYFPEVGSGDQWDAREKYLGRFLARASLVVTGTHAGSTEIQTFYRIDADRIRVVPFPKPPAWFTA